MIRVPHPLMHRLGFEPCGLLLHRIVELLNAQHRLHPGDESRLIHGLGQILVGSGVQASHVTTTQLMLITQKIHVSLSSNVIVIKLLCQP